MCQPLTSRRATWLVLRRETTRTEAETQQRLMVHSFGEAHVAGFDAAAVLHAAMKAATNGSADA